MTAISSGRQGASLVFGLMQQAQFEPTRLNAGVGVHE